MSVRRPRCPRRPRLATSEFARIRRFPPCFSQSDAILRGCAHHDVGRARCCKVLAKLPQAKGRTKEELLPIIDRYHEAAGASLAIAWNLPPEVAEACQNHHEPTTPIACLVAAADAVAYLLDTPPRATEHDVALAMARIGVTPDEASEFLDPLRAELAARVSAVTEVASARTSVQRMERTTTTR